MDYIIMPFKSRAESIKYSKILKDNGIMNALINTPKEVGIGCGLSVQISIGFYEYAKRIISINKSPSFVGFFLVKKTGKSFTVKSI